MAYVAGVAGAIILSAAMLRTSGLSGLAVWALPISVTAAAALVVQFVAFGAQAREARSAAAGPSVAGAAQAGAFAAAPAPAAAVSATATAVPPASAPLAAGVPPQLGAAPAPTVVVAAASLPRPDRPGGAAGVLHDLAGYAGLYQRIFVGLLMAWTLLVALGVLAS